MRRTFTLLACMLFAFAGFSQTFTTIATDGQGDDHSGIGTDAKSLSYLIDFNQDSIWFQIETWQDRHADWGYVLALDTDQVALNGKPIPQHNLVGTPNNDMTYDFLIYIYENSFFPGLNWEVYDTSSYVLTTGTYKALSPKIAIIGFKLSDFDADGDMNVIGGVGSFDISATGPHDIMPNTGFGTTSSTVSVEENLAIDFTMYPNPATDRLFIDISNRKSTDKIRILSALGTTVLESSFKEDLYIGNLESGLYIVIIERDGKAISTRKLAVKH